MSISRILGVRLYFGDSCTLGLGFKIGLAGICIRFLFTFVFVLGSVLDSHVRDGVIVYLGSVWCFHLVACFKESVLVWFCFIWLERLLVF